MDSEIYFDEATESHKSWLWWLYLMHGASLVFSLGALSFIPLILNYLKRDKTEGSFLRTHHSWQIRSFWWYIVWLLVGGALFMTIFGIPLAGMVWLGAWVWKAYRLLRGFLDLDKNRAMPGYPVPAPGRQ
jgi:uncharacterized membrane protein